MFTGIIEETGIVEKISSQGTNKSFWIRSALSSLLKIDQSVSHNGVCLTVEVIEQDLHRVTAIEETLKKTNLGYWQEADTINLERCMQMNGRIDGHIVQGHVDTIATCSQVITKEGSWEYSFTIDENFAALIIEKGSITLNGISLTIFNVGANSFTVAVIPYTYNHRNMPGIKEGSSVNIEFDMIGKYVSRFMQLR